MVTCCWLAGGLGAGEADVLPGGVGVDSKGREVEHELAGVLRHVEPDAALLDLADDAVLVAEAGFVDQHINAAAGQVEIAGFEVGGNAGGRVASRLACDVRRPKGWGVLRE